MWDKVTIPLGIEQSLDTIFSAVLVGGLDKNSPTYQSDMTQKIGIARATVPWFRNKFPVNVFNNTYAVFYEMLVTLGLRAFTIDQLESVVDSNRELILDSPFVDVAKYKMGVNGNIASDDDIINAFTADLKEKFIYLSGILVSEEEFQSSCNIYITWYKDNLMWYACNNMGAIMSDVGFDCKKPGKRTKHYHGIDDANDYYNENKAIINALSDENRIEHKVLDEKWLHNDLKHDTDGDVKRLFKLGIKSVDEAYGYMRRGNMLGIAGGPKMGKTRLTNTVVQRALSLGFNVCVWTLDGESDEWEATQESCLIAYESLENARKAGTDNIIRISSKDILERRFNKKPEIRKLIAAAKTEMAISEKRGKLSFINGTAYCEDFLDVILDHYNNTNPFDVIVIDSLVNVLSRKGKGKVERIADAYMQFKDFIANKLKVPALAIIPTQLKQEAVDEIRKNPDADMSVTAGAESAETIRTPDYVIGIFSTKEERKANIAHLYSVASRHNGDFDKTTLKAYYDCCMFLDSEDNE